VARNSRALVVYRDALFRDCILAILAESGWRQLRTLEREDFRPEDVENAEAVIVEVEKQDSDWWRTVQPALRKQGASERVLVLGVSFDDDEARLLVSQRVGNAAPARLLDLLEAWSGDGDR
jgi:hypothetical protein